MIHGFDWTHTPHKEDLEHDSQTPERFRFWKKFKYIQTAKRFGEVVHVETTTVYARTEHIFNELIRHWNALGNSNPPLNPGLTWHYAAAPEPTGGSI